MLTEREQRLKQKLVDGLDDDLLPGTPFGGMSYAVKKHVCEELDPAFVQATLEKMRPRVRRARWAFGLSALGYALLFGWQAVEATSAALTFATVCVALTAGAFAGLAYRSIRHRVWIYEMLAELAGAAPAALPEAAPEIERTETVQHATYETIQRR